MVDKLKYIWMDGKLVDWDDANVHVMTHSFHYGCSAFEGIRSYVLDDGRSAVYRLREHIQRLFDSCHIVQMTIPYTFDQIMQACLDVLRGNELQEGYIRPIAYIGEGVMGVHPRDNPIRVVIMTWKWGKYLGPEALEKGIRAKISSFNRYHVNNIMTKGKLSGNYVSSVLAKREAVSLGFDEAIMLDTEGYVAEGSGENIFIVSKGKVKTTSLTSILPGITRDSVLTFAPDLGLQIIEERFTRDELYTADEAFFTGTAAEVTPIREVDGRKIKDGVPGPITRKIQAAYFDIVRGKNKKYQHWLTPVDVSAPKKIPAAAKHR